MERVADTTGHLSRIGTEATAGGVAHTLPVLGLRGPRLGHVSRLVVTSVTVTEGVNCFSLLT